MKNAKLIYFDQKKDSDKNAIRRIDLTIQELHNCLDNIENILAGPEDNFELLKAICYDLIRRFPLFTKTYPAGFVLRGRRNETAKPFTNISEISYNSKIDLVEIGRFNLDRDPAFYCSEPSANGGNTDAAMTCLLESCKEILLPNSTTNAEYVTIGKWKIIKPITVVFLSLFERAENKCNYFKLVNDYLLSQSEDLFQTGEKEKCALIYNYFSTKAGTTTDSRKGYLITTAFYHALKEFYETDKIGVVYSSAATDNSGLNMVLSPGFVDKKYLEFDFCIMYKCRRDRFNYKRYDIFPCSTEGRADLSGNFEIRVNK